MKFLIPAFFVSALLVHARPALDRPNIIVILLDDAGYADFSHTGNPVIHTPNVSRMAQEGANFPQFYSGAAACSASRYSLLTGRNSLRSGLPSWAIAPDAERYLHPRETTLAEGLKHRGYSTAMFGKWHLGTPNEANGHTPDALPLAHGFDRWLGTNVSNDYDPGVDLILGPSVKQDPARGYENVEKDIARNTPVQENLTARYSEAAIQFIHEKKKEPFFIFLAPNMPHLPVHASDRFKGKSLNGAYGDCIEEIDFHLGKVREALEQNGLTKNTLLIFTSDNGPWIKFLGTASHPLYMEARALIGTAQPFRDGKGSTWEGGQRVPGVWCWPGTIPAGTVIPGPASSMDILPTVFALAGESLPGGVSIEGRDIRPYLNSSRFPGSIPDFRFFYSTSEAVNAVRVGPWKLHVHLTSQTGAESGFTATPARPLLFHLEHDPSERIDRSSEEALRVKTLSGAIRDFEASISSEDSYWDRP